MQSRSVAAVAELGSLGNLDAFWFEVALVFVFIRFSMIKATVDILSGPNKGIHILDLVIAPKIGHYVGDQKGNYYKIRAIVHLMDSHEIAEDSLLRLLVEDMPASKSTLVAIPDEL